MASIYLLYSLFPIWILHSVSLHHEKKSNVYMDKNDTKNLRGIAACCVVAAHFCAWLKELNVRMNPIFYALFSQLGGIGVLIFFFVSGYGIYSSYGNRLVGWDYVKKRAYNVYFPYVIMKIILLFITSVMSGQIKFDLYELASIFLIEDWFIHVILVQYIAFFLIRKFIKTDKIILFSLFADILISGVFIFERKPERWFNALWLFTFGMFCNKYAEKVAYFFKKKALSKVIAIFILFSILGLFFTTNKGIYWVNLVKPLSGILLCLGIYGILGKVTISSSIWAYLGERSMYIYIVHIHMWFMLASIKNVTYRFWIVLVLSIVVSEIIYKLIRISSKKL